MSQEAALMSLLQKSGHMQKGRLAYCHLLTGNAEHAAAAFVSQYGFKVIGGFGLATGHTDETGFVLAGLDSILVISSPLLPGGAAADFLRDHGEGVRDIGVWSADPDTDRLAAINGGATESSYAPSWRRSGFCSFQTPVGASITLLPHGADESGDAGSVRGYDHLAVAVAHGTLASAERFFVDALGFQVVMRETVDLISTSMDSVVVRRRDWGVTITVVSPGSVEDGGQITEFLQFNGGPGVQHIAFQVGSLTNVVDELRERGVSFLNVPSSYYDELPTRTPELDSEIAALRARSILADRDHDGHLLQLFTMPVTARPTLFLEFVERRGDSSGFGAGNIRALFEAKELERLERRGELPA